MKRNRSDTIRSVCASVALAAAALCGQAEAATVDLVTGSSGSANGTIYLRDDAQPTGTGVFQPFLRVQGNGNADTEQGYNADYGPASQVPFDEKVGTWTHALQFSDLHLTTIGGVDYFEFLLDLDEPNAGSKFGISLDSVQIFNSGSTALSAPFSTDLSTLGTMLYDMDTGADGDTSVLMDGARTHGNGQSDMAMYILASNFAGVTASDFITFYSLFGVLDDGAVDGSFEEWSVRDESGPGTGPGPIPLPGTMWLMGVGLLVFGALRGKSLA